MKVGIPKEIKNHEYRVAITPAGVMELVRNGHDVVIERDAGLGSSIPNEDYEKAGATILPGVTIGEEAIVGSGSIVSHDVPAGMVAVGVPAKVVRERRTEGRHGEDLDHLWLF